MQGGHNNIKTKYSKLKQKTHQMLNLNKRTKKLNLNLNQHLS